MRKLYTALALLLFLTSSVFAQDAKITDLPASGAIVDTDLFEVVDVSDPTLAATGTNKKLTSAQLSNYFKTALQDTFYTETEINSGFQPLDVMLTYLSNLDDPGADRILFWDDTAGTIEWLTLGTNLSITDTTIDATDTDEQTIDTFSLGGTTLSLSLERDGEIPQTVDLSSLQDGTGTDDQTLDVAQLNGTNLELSIEDDGEATHEIDLSSLQDGTGTDDQTAAEVSILDAGDYYTATDVEAALAEVYTSAVSELSDLSDVGVTTATDRNALMADGDSWESRALVEADISDLGSYITSAGVTYENLSANSDIGTGATQVAQGDHAHAGTYEPIDSTILREADVDDTPVDGVTTAPVSSNWAYDHGAASDPHAGYVLESAAGSAHTRDAEDILTNGSNLPDGAAIITYGTANWDDTGTDDQTASEVATTITNFDNHLSASDDTVQKALETLDEIATGGATQLSDLSDVNTSTPTNRYVLVADGIDFESRSLVEADISDLGSYITSSGVTYENLSANSDIGTGSTQVSQGDHAHSGTYEPADATIVKDGDFTSDGFLIRSGGSGSYSVDTNTYSVSTHDHSGTYEPVDSTILREADVDDTPVDGVTSAPVSSNWAYDHAATHAPSNADNTAANETSHADVVVDGDFTVDGLLARSGGAGSYTVDTSTYIEASGVTYENLSTNGDIGNGGGQVADGTHVHDYEPADTAIVKSDEDETITADWNFSGDIVFTEKADHSSTPEAGYGYLWVKSTDPSTLIFTDDGGTDYTLGSAGATQLTDLSDVSSSTKTNRNVLVANGSTFASRALVEADISDLGSYEPVDSTILREADVDDTPVDGVTAAPVSSNWAYDHEADITTKHLPAQATHSGEFLTTDGSVASWTTVSAGATELSELSDVGVTTPTDTYVLVADGDSWESRALTEADISDLGSYAEALADLSDVGVTTPTDTYVLVADGDSWESRALTEADISDLGTYLTSVELSDLTDVGVTTPTNTYALMADGDSWESRAIVEADISDLGSYLTSETSHADVVVDGDFTSDGILVRSGGAGSYSVITDSSTNWDTAYDHSQAAHAPTDAIQATDVTYENLSTNGDVGTGSDQVSQGDHSHSYLSDVSDDSSPTLGGDLDVVNYEIGSATGTGNVVFELGDLAGTNFFEIEDSSDASIFSFNSNGDITIIEAADHTVTPTAGYGYLWVKSDTPSSLIFTADDGTDYDLTNAGTDDQTASEVNTSTGSFDGHLSGSDTTVQAALDTLDDISTGGGMSWAIQASGTTAVANNGYMVDTSGGAITITLPASPSEGDRVGILDKEGTFDSFNCTVGRNSLNIMGVAEDLVLDGENSAVILVYSDATHGWRIESVTPVSSGASYVAKTEIDSTSDSLSLITGGEIQGKINIVNKSSTATLTDDETHGSMVFVSAATTITLPAVSIGNSVCLYSTGANTIIIDSNASDRIRLEGAALSDGYTIENTSAAAGDFMCLVGDSADGWTTLGFSGTWADGGAT